MMGFKGLIFIECKTDMALVLKIVPSKRFVRCAGGIGEVCNKLKDSENSCGLVDEDLTKPRPKYMINLLSDPNLIISNDHDVVVVHDRVRNNYLIVLRPDREGWLIKTAKILGIDLRRFDLPNDPKEFKRISLIKPKRVERLIDEILTKDHPRVRELYKAFGFCNHKILTTPFGKTA